MGNTLNALKNRLGDSGDRITESTAYEIVGPIVRPGETKGRAIGGNIVIRSPGPMQTGQETESTQCHHSVCR